MRCRFFSADENLTCTTQKKIRIPAEFLSGISAPQNPSKGLQSWLNSQWIFTFFYFLTKPCPNIKRISHGVFVFLGLFRNQEPPQNPTILTSPQKSNQQKTQGTSFFNQRLYVASSFNFLFLALRQESLKTQRAQIQECGLQAKVQHQSDAALCQVGERCGVLVVWVGWEHSFS